MNSTTENKYTYEELARGLIEMARAHKGQPIAVVCEPTSGDIQAGVLDWYGLEPQDWFFQPETVQIVKPGDEQIGG